MVAPRSSGRVCDSPFELRSVNSRYLDIQVRCPAELQPFESAIRERIQARVGRGKISAHIAWAEDNQPEALPQLDEAAAKHYLAQLRRLAELARVEAAENRAVLPRPKAFFARVKGLEQFDVGIERVLLAKLPQLFRVQAAALDSVVVQDGTVGGVETKRWSSWQPCARPKEVLSPRICAVASKRWGGCWSA